MPTRSIKLAERQQAYLNDLTARMISPIDADALTATERSLSVLRSASRRPFKRILLCNDLPIFRSSCPWKHPVTEIIGSGSLQECDSKHNRACAVVKTTPAARQSPPPCPSRECQVQARPAAICLPAAALPFLPCCHGPACDRTPQPPRQRSVQEWQGALGSDSVAWSTFFTAETVLDRVTFPQFNQRAKKTKSSPIRSQSDSVD